MAAPVAVGAVKGLLEPMTDEDNYWAEKAKQVGAGIGKATGMDWLKDKLRR
jgi:hypothetical protein